MKIYCLTFLFIAFSINFGYCNDLGDSTFKCLILLNGNIVLPQYIIKYNLLYTNETRVDTFKLNYEVGLLKISKEVFDPNLVDIEKLSISIQLSCAETDYKTTGLIIGSPLMIFKSNNYLIVNFISPCNKRKKRKKRIFFSEYNYQVYIQTDKNISILENKHCL